MRQMPTDPDRVNQKDTLPFQPLADYSVPSLPADESIRNVFSLILHLFQKDSDSSFIESSKLRSTEIDRLDDVVPGPAYGSVIEELDLTVSEWLADPSPAHHVFVINLPPCDRDGIVERWANQKELAVLSPPQRDQLLDPKMNDVPDLDGEGPLVIPRLEDWFLRHHYGLSAVQQLLKKVHTGDRRYIVSCGTWGWHFLIRAVGTDMFLPPPYAPQPYDGDRLVQWFAKMLAESNHSDVIFRLSKTGENVLAVDKNGKLKNNHLKKLAAQGLGIPWVLWNLWRASLRSDRHAKDDNGNDFSVPKSDEQTLWVVDHSDLTIPGMERRSGLLILHALLVHGGQTAEELTKVLPEVIQGSIIEGLVAAGFVELVDRKLVVCPAAYSEVRSELFAAGFPCAPL